MEIVTITFVVYFYFSNCSIFIPFKIMFCILMAFNSHFRYVELFLIKYDSQEKSNQILLLRIKFVDIL